MCQDAIEGRYLDPVQRAGPHRIAGPTCDHYPALASYQSLPMARLSCGWNEVDCLMGVAGIDRA